MTSVKLDLNKHAVERLQEDRVEAEKLFSQLWVIKAQRSWGIDGSTFRGYRNHFKPSRQYQSWAMARATALVNAPDDGFHPALLHEQLVAHLCDTWRNDVLELSVAHLHKTVDLFFLHMARCQELSDHKRQVLIGNCNPPLDKFTLSGLAVLVPGLVVGNLSMGSIADAEEYKALQKVIEQITRIADVPKLYFDIWCWPEARRRNSGLRDSTMNPTSRPSLSK